MLALNLARPRPAAPPGAPTRPARGMSGLWIQQISSNRMVMARSKYQLEMIMMTRLPEHRSNASSSMLDPDLESEPSLTKEKIDIFGDDGRDDDTRMARPLRNSFDEWTAEEPVIIPHFEEVNLMVLKPSFKSRKSRELNSKLFDTAEHETFIEADTKQWQQHLDLGAVDVVPSEKTKCISKDKILPIASRFVRTNKNKDPMIQRRLSVSI